MAHAQKLREARRCESWTCDVASDAPIQRRVLGPIAYAHACLASFAFLASLAFLPTWASLVFGIGFLGFILGFLIGVLCFLGFFDSLALWPLALEPLASLASSDFLCQGTAKATPSHSKAVGFKSKALAKAAKAHNLHRPLRWAAWALMGVLVVVLVVDMALVVLVVLMVS